VHCGPELSPQGRCLLVCISPRQKAHLASPCSFYARRPRASGRSVLGPGVWKLEDGPPGLTVDLDELPVGGVALPPNRNGTSGKT